VNFFFSNKNKKGDYCIVWNCALNGWQIIILSP
jgi:hypothetical protein